MASTCKKLTIGMVVFDDFDGFYFSIQAIRLYHSEILNEVEFIIIDNNPTSVQGIAVEKFCQKGCLAPFISYYKGDNSMGTSSRSKIFEYAKTPYVFVMDCHVLLEAGSLRKLIDFFDQGEDDGNFLQAPMLSDNLTSCMSHFQPVWRSGMYGIWANDPQVNEGKPFEIPGQGLGVFACRKDSWVGFTKGHRGFGGEELIINEKFKKHSKKTLCLPWLKWLHRFERPLGVPYPNRWEDRFKNYILGFRELGWPVDEVIEHFKTQKISEITINKWLEELSEEDRLIPKEIDVGADIQKEKNKYDGIYSSKMTYGVGNNGRDCMHFIEWDKIKSIIDIGCGQNFFIKNIRNLYANIESVGVDISCPSADIITDATKLPFKDKHFDLACSFDTLEHIPPSAVADSLHEIARISKSFAFSISYRASVILWKGENLHPTVWPEKKWIDEISAAGGIKIVKKGRYILGHWA